MFELFLRDEFLPIYTHGKYTSMFDQSQIQTDRTPDRASA